MGLSSDSTEAGVMRYSQLKMCSWIQRDDQGGFVFFSVAGCLIFVALIGLDPSCHIA